MVLIEKHFKVLMLLEFFKFRQMFLRHNKKELKQLDFCECHSK